MHSVVFTVLTVSERFHDGATHKRLEIASQHSSRRLEQFDVERHTATGNDVFYFTRLGATTYVVVTRIETIYLKIRAHPPPKNEKLPLPVVVRRSKTSLLKLSNIILDLLGIY